MMPKHRSAPTVWQIVEPGSYVARRGGHHVGGVVSTGSGNYVALDGDSEAIGSYPSLAAAKESVHLQDRFNTAAYIPRRQLHGVIIATVAGIAAIALLVLVIWYATMI